MTRRAMVRETVTHLSSSQRFDEALKFLGKLEKERELTPYELVTKGRCIQLASEGEGWELEEAANVFKQALEIEPEYVPALIELGFFYFAVEGNASKALPLFEER